MKLLLACVAALGSVTAQPVIRAHFSPAGSALVGQPVHLTVDVLVPTFFMSSVEFPTFEVPSAITKMDEGQPPHLNETINGTQYTGVSKNYLIYPETVGDFTLPPAEVVFKYSLEGAKQSPETRLKLPPAKFTATIPPEAEGLGYFIATTGLTVSQHFDKKLVGLKVGDTIHRTITVRANQTFAMFLPPLSFEPSEGLRVYPDEPKTSDQTGERGEFLGGTRVDGATYLIQKEGTYTLPEIDVSYWQTGANTMRTTRLRALQFTAAPNPGYQPELTPYVKPELPPQPVQPSLWDRAKVWVVGAGVVLVLALMFLWLRPRLKREPHEDTTQDQFARFRRAASHNDAPGAMRELMRWLDRLRGSGGATIRGAQQKLHNRSFGNNADELEKALYSKGAPIPWQRGNALADSAAVALKEYQREQRHHREKTTLLPPLNP